MKYGKYSLILLPCLALTVWLFHLNCLHTFIVHGESMMPTYQPEAICVGRPIHMFTPLYRGDIIVASEGGDLIVKRIIGLPGETILIDQGHVYIDGHLLIEPISPML